MFSGFVGREHDHFVHHHIRRSYATVITHACLLLGYLGLVYVYIGERAFLPPGDDTTLAVIKVFVWWIALGCGLMAVAMAEIWRLNGWRRHPIIQRLEKYPGGWRAASDSISTDFRRMDKIYVKLGFQAVLVTDRWIVRVGMYGLDIASQRDVDISIAGTQTVQSHKVHSRRVFSNFMSLCTTLIGSIARRRGRRGTNPDPESDQLKPIPVHHSTQCRSLPRH